jgi:hypothetical protein
MFSNKMKMIHTRAIVKRINRPGIFKAHAASMQGVKQQTQQEGKFSHLYIVLIFWV